MIAEGPEVRPLRALDALDHDPLRRELTLEYLLFDAFVAGQRRVDVHPLVLPIALHQAAVRAAEEVVAGVGAVARRALFDEEERARYRLHDEVIALARASHRAGDDASLMRVDLLLDEHGAWRACEINADCPGGHNEAHGLPRLARSAGFYDGTNPTFVVPALVERIAELAARPDGSTGTCALLYATAYAEDLQICALLKRALDKRGVRAVLCAPTAPRLLGDHLTVRGERVDVLYRFFPAEYMEGQRNVGDVIRAVEAGKVRTISGFSHVYTQSKLAFARAWDAGFHAHLPATFELGDVARDDLLANRARWVLKRAFGRVGDQVFVGALASDEDWASIVAEVLLLEAAGESWIAQEFVPQRAIATHLGPRLVTLGAYVLDGRFVGYFSRVSRESHVSHDALCLPVFVARGPRDARGGP